MTLATVGLIFLLFIVMQHTRGPLYTIRLLIIISINNALLVENIYNSGFSLDARLALKLTTIRKLTKHMCSIKSPNMSNHLLILEVWVINTAWEWRT